MTDALVADFDIKLAVKCPRDGGPGSYAAVVSHRASGLSHAEISGFDQDGDAVTLEAEALLRALRTAPRNSVFVVHGSHDLIDFLMPPGALGGRLEDLVTDLRQAHDHPLKVFLAEDADPGVARATLLAEAAFEG